MSVTINKADFIEHLTQLLARSGYRQYITTENKAALQEWFFVPQVELITPDVDPETGEDILSEEVNSINTEVIIGLTNQIDTLSKTVGEYKEDVEAVLGLIDGSQQNIASFNDQINGFRGDLEGLKSNLLDYIPGDKFNSIPTISSHEARLKTIEENTGVDKIVEIVNNNLPDISGIETTVEFLIQDAQRLDTEISDRISLAVTPLATSQELKDSLQVYTKTEFFDQEIDVIGVKIGGLRAEIDAFDYVDKIDLDALRDSIIGLENKLTQQTGISEERIIQLIAENTSPPVLEKRNSLFKDWRGVVHQESDRGMLVTTSDKDANFMVAGKGIATLFLGVKGEDANLDSWSGIDIAEWVLIGGAENSQSQSYLNAFGELGAKEGAMILWTSYQGGIGGYLIINRDGTTYMSGDR